MTALKAARAFEVDFVVTSLSRSNIVKIMPSGAMVICDGLTAEEALFETMKTVFASHSKTSDLPFPDKMTVVEYEPRALPAGNQNGVVQG